MCQVEFLADTLSIKFGLSLDNLENGQILEYLGSSAQGRPFRSISWTTKPTFMDWVCEDPHNSYVSFHGMQIVNCSYYKVISFITVQALGLLFMLMFSGPIAGLQMCVARKNGIFYLLHNATSCLTCRQKSTLIITVLKVC